MPVSLERLAAEQESAVITEELTRECIQVRPQPVARTLVCVPRGAVPRTCGAWRPHGAPRTSPFSPRAAAYTRAGRTVRSAAPRQVTGCDADLAEERRKQVVFKEVEALAFSFRNLARISSLGGLDRLTRLRLDNNRLTRIEGVAHLVGRRHRGLGPCCAASWARGRRSSGGVRTFAGSTTRLLQARTPAQQAARLCIAAARACAQTAMRLALGRST